MKNTIKELKKGFYKMEHRGGLIEALETAQEISEIDYKNLLATNKYKYYCYDARIKANRYILKDIEKDYKNYSVWLLERK